LRQRVWHFFEKSLSLSFLQRSRPADVGVNLTACVQTIGYIEGIEDKDMTNFKPLDFHRVGEEESSLFMNS
jgi:hypothetical protein